MDDLKTLQDRIATLSSNAESVSVQGRDIMADGMTEAVLAISREIEETLLQRQLVFTNDRQDSIALLVSSGRVLKLSEPVSSQLMERCSGLIDQTLSDDDPAQVAVVADVIGEFASGTRKVLVTSHLVSAGEDVVKLGIRAKTLFRSCADAEDDAGLTPRPNCLDNFLETCSQHASALLRLDGDKVLSEIGPAEQLRGLMQLAEEVHRSIPPEQNETCGDAGQRKATILGGYPDTGSAIFWASDSSGSVLFMFDIRDLKHVVDSWQSSGAQDRQRRGGFASKARQSDVNGQNF